MIAGAVAPTIVAATRQGRIMSVLRQPGKGQAVGGTFRGFTASKQAGTKTETLS